MWKVAKPQGPKLITSVDSARPMGYEGWKKLIIPHGSSPFLVSPNIFLTGKQLARTPSESYTWTDPTKEAWCRFHRKCQQNQLCAAKVSDSALTDEIYLTEIGQEGTPEKLQALRNRFISGCHANSSSINENCPCGFYSYPTLKEVLDLPIIEDNSDHFGKAEIIARLVHHGRVLKGTSGVKSQMVTLTGLMRSPDISEIDDSFLDDENFKKRDQLARTKLPQFSRLYNLPILDWKRPEDGPSSAEVMDKLEMTA